MLVGLVIAHSVLTSAAWAARADLDGAPERGACITANSLSPVAGSGVAQVFEARYGHCEGAAAFRVVQLWVGDEVTPTADRVNLGFEDGMLTLENGGSCAPGDPVVLMSTHGGIDCATSTVQQSGNEMIVQWSLVFDVDAFAGAHSVFFDAKGGTGDPEPRLEWTPMGTFTVVADAGSTGVADESGGGTSDASGSTTAPAPSESSGSGGVASTSTGTTGGGLPGATPHRRGAAGCTCASASPSSALWFGLVALWLRRRRS